MKFGGAVGLLVLTWCRFANSCDSDTRHTADARQRVPVVLLRVLRLRHRRRSAVGWAVTSSVHSSTANQRNRTCYQARLLASCICRLFSSSKYNIGDLVLYRSVIKQ